MKFRIILGAALISAAITTPSFAYKIFVPKGGRSVEQQKADAEGCKAQLLAKMKDPAFIAKIKEEAAKPNVGAVIGWGLFCGPLCAIAEAASPSGPNRAAAAAMGREFMFQCFERKGYRVQR